MTVKPDILDLRTSLLDKPGATSLWCDSSSSGQVTGPSPARGEEDHRIGASGLGRGLLGFHRVARSRDIFRCPSVDSPQGLYKIGQMEVLALLLLGLACAGYTGSVASSKGHDVGPWALGGFLLGPFALLACLGLPDLKSRRYLRLLAEHHGVEIESRHASPLEGQVDADEQRRRILGGK